MKRKKRMAAFIKVDDLLVAFWRNFCFYYKLLYYYYYDLLIKHICNTPINLFHSFIHSYNILKTFLNIYLIYNIHIYIYITLSKYKLLTLFI